jgi:hypothetical protein
MLFQVVLEVLVAEAAVGLLHPQVVQVERVELRTAVMVLQVLEH